MIDFLNSIKDIKGDEPFKSIAKEKKKYVKKEVSLKASGLVLAAVGANVDVTADRIMTNTGYYRDYVVRILHSLFKNGLLTRKRDPNNSYSYVYTKKD